MKKILVVLLVLAALASVVGCILGATASRIFAADTLRGSGKIVTRTIPAPEFHSVDVSRAVKVVLTDEPSGQIRIDADDNLIELVTVEAKKGVLKVSIDPSARSVTHMNVTVTVPVGGPIRALKASSASKIIGQTVLHVGQCTVSASSAAGIDVALEGGSCKVDASSAADIDVSMNGESCTVDVSSASKVQAALEVGDCTVGASSAAKAELSGSAARCRAHASSGAKIAAGELVVTDLRISASSGAKAVVCCTGTLDADASSGSKILYSGDCEVHAERSSGASIRKN